jgi:hypothetical protein
MNDANNFPFPYGSDLHNLWGWGDRLRARIDDDDEIPIGQLKECESWTFRPDRSAFDAMQRFGENHYVAIKQVDDALTWANTAFDAFLLAPSDSTRSDFADALELLCHRIETTVETIAGKQQPAATATWYHGPDVEKPDGFDFGPLTEAAKILNEWIGGSADRKALFLHAQGRHGRVWIVKRDRYTYQVWFRTQREMDAAKGRAEAPKTRAAKLKSHRK